MNRASRPRRKARMTKALGSHGYTVHAAEQQKRDELFDKYLRAVDQYQHWQDPKLYATKIGENRNGMLKLLQQHINTLREQMVRLDEIICLPGQREQANVEP